MISKKFRKMGEARGFVTAKGICYGEVNGYTVTLSEENSFRYVCINAAVTEMVHQNLIANEQQIRDTYKINMEYHSTCVIASFRTGIGKKIEDIDAFLNVYTSQLAAAGCPRSADTCIHCNMSMDATSRRIKFVGGRAMHLHEGCAQQLADALHSQSEQLSTAKSNAGKGILGALLFGLIGALPWAILYALGYFVAWAGLLIGIMAVKGYQKFDGIIKKSTIALLALLIVLLVIGAQLLGVVFEVGAIILGGEVWGTLANIPFYMNTLFGNSEYVSSFVGNILLGLVFAGLGLFGLFRSLISSVADMSKSIVDLPEKNN